MKLKKKDKEPITNFVLLGKKREILVILVNF